MTAARRNVVTSLPGKATHYRPGRSNVSACGIVTPEYAAYDPRHVDCQRCLLWIVRNGATDPKNRPPGWLRFDAARHTNGGGK